MRQLLRLLPSRGGVSSSESPVSLRHLPRPPVGPAPYSTLLFASFPFHVRVSRVEFGLARDSSLLHMIGFFFRVHSTASDENCGISFIYLHNVLYSVLLISQLVPEFATYYSQAISDNAESFHFRGMDPPSTPRRYWKVQSRARSTTPRSSSNIKTKAAVKRDLTRVGHQSTRTRTFGLYWALYRNLACLNVVACRWVPLTKMRLYKRDSTSVR